MHNVSEKETVGKVWINIQSKKMFMQKKWQTFGQFLNHTS